VFERLRDACPRRRRTPATVVDWYALWVCVAGVVLLAVTR